MAKSANQKKKLPILAKLLLERSDEEHPITTQEMLAELARWDISAERKSIYDDMEQLRQLGLDVQSRKGKEGGWFVGERDFELAELKLLVDAVQSSRFLTGRKSDALIRKLEGLTSVHQARQLQRQVYVDRRIKTMNESIYYNVDKLHNAISANRQITFEYTRWGMTDKVRLLNKGKIYKISPWMLSWTDENYYLIGYDSEQEMIKHFRVDKMIRIELTDEKRDGKEAFEKTDPAIYSKNMFGMFSGENEMLSIQIPEYLLGAFVDRFGKEISVRKMENGYFIVHVQAIISEQFFGWLTGLGKDVIILSPQKTVREYREYLGDILAKYK